MKINFLSMLAVVALVAVVSISGCTQYGQSGGNQTSTNSVSIKNFTFNPSEITIKKGETVVWTNEDSTSHTVTSDSGNELDSGSITPGQTYSHTFNTAGTFDYHCSIHTSMKGRVTVE